MEHYTSITYISVVHKIKPFRVHSRNQKKDKLSTKALNCKVIFILVPKQALWDWMMSGLIPVEQLTRFETHNITVTFLEDEYALSGPEWLEADLLFDFDGRSAV